MANDLMIARAETLDMVETKIKELQKNGGINFPPNYSVSNALQSAWLTLQETEDKDHHPALEVCTRSSIANALLTMAIQGLSPSKKQVYFIVYGQRLSAMRSYFGTIAVTKRVKGVVDVYGQVVYQGDIFEFEVVNGAKRVTKHEQKLENIDSDKIAAAYCTIVLEDGQEYTGILTWKQIKVAWLRTKMGQNKNHLEFPEDMAIRTVINKTCKMFANTSDDSDLFLGLPDEDEATDNPIDLEIAQNSNGKLLDIHEEPEEQEHDNQEGPLPHDIPPEHPEQREIFMEEPQQQKPKRGPQF